MSIERIGHIDPIQPGRGSGRNSRIEKNVNEGDSVSISGEARTQAEFLRALDVVKEAPDVRAARIAEIKQKINSPGYINDILISATADKIADSIARKSQQNLASYRIISFE
ncbi:MAG: flagellar biosynthesis anti-sigma factor FlgM [Spirochaetaceae bacterium]|jgi:negative regulator of flagellin synthesis FlgM|nr:flagellar biosynthesis anti-sigma factor FlgM [Spirochaetaceae bacterium]